MVGGLFIRNLNDVRGSLCNEPPYIQEFIEEKKKCICTNNKLENELMYLY